MKDFLKVVKKGLDRAVTILYVLLIIVILLLAGIALADEAPVEKPKVVKTKQSAVMTARFSDRHNCSIEYLGKNIFITATHCIQYVFERDYGNLNAIEIRNNLGLFKVLHYSMDRGVAITDGFALFEVFMLDFSNYEVLEVANEYTTPTNLHCYPALRSGLIVEVKSKIKHPTRLSPTRVVGVGSVGPGCSGGAWLSDKRKLIAVTSGGWGNTGVSTAVIIADHYSLITNILNGARPKIMTWDAAKKIFRPGELKRRNDEEKKEDKEDKEDNPITAEH